MLKNYLKIAWRQLSKNKLFSLINISGLAIGLTVSLLLFLYIRKELSFDRDFRQSDNIYRIVFNADLDGKVEKWAGCPNNAGHTFKSSIADIRAQSRWIRHEFGRSANVLYKDKKFFEKNLYWADSSLTTIFDLPFIAGNPATALTRPNCVIISKSIAEKYFGKEEPLGKVLKIDNNYSCEVTGVYKDFPHTSTLDADLIGSIYSVGWMVRDQPWSNASFETWLLLNPATDPAKVEKQIKATVDREVAKADQWFSFSLQPLRKVHLYSEDIKSYTSRPGDLRQVKIVSILALVIILIACINYMNLATARSQKRFREVGINKTIGATSGMLVRKFYAETGLFVLLSVLAGIALLILAIPLFNSLTGEQLSAGDLLHPGILLAILISSILITVIAGSYPALYLSSFNPKNLFHQTFTRKSMAGRFRQGLVVLQFSASIILIIATVLFYRQLQFIQSKKLGFQPEQVVAVTTSAVETKDQIDGLLTETRSLAAVKYVCRTQTYPGRSGSGRGINKEGAGNEKISLTTCRATAGIEKVLGLKLLAGAGLPEVKADTDSTVQVLLTKKAVDFLGFTPEEVIGRKVAVQLGNNSYVVGVVDDFNNESLHKPIGAYAFHNAKTESRSFMLVKLNAEQLPQAMRQLEAVYRRHVPNGAFEYTFLDQYMQSLYSSEQRTASIVLVFSGLAIFIACLGLFGLAAFVAEQRTKEIGVRKVLGASVVNIVGLLSGNFLRLVLLSILIAVPIAWWMMNRWLQDFAYRTTISWWVFVLAGFIAIMIALITVSSQAVRAALTNPVKSLRTE